MLNSQCKFHVKTSDRSSPYPRDEFLFFINNLPPLTLSFFPLSFLSLSLFPSYRRACKLPSRVSGVFIFRFVPLSFNKNRIHLERRWEWISRWIYVYTRKLVMQCRILMPLFILDPSWTDTNISPHDFFSLSSSISLFFSIFINYSIDSRPLVLSSSIHPFILTLIETSPLLGPR